MFEWNIADEHVLENTFTGRVLPVKVSKDIITSKDIQKGNFKKWM